MEFTVQFRSTWIIRQFATVAAALDWAFTTGKAFDVSNPSGAIVWAWEQR